MSGSGLESGYEYDIRDNPYSIHNWLAYLEYLSAEPFLTHKQPIFARAVTALPRSYKLWWKYLSEYEAYAKQFPPTHEVYAIINDKFEESLQLLEKMPLLWKKYLNFLLLQPHLITHTRNTFNKALQQLTLTHHLEHIWPLFLQFAKQCPSTLTKVTIWERYMGIAPECREDFIDALIDAKNWDRVAIEFQKVLTSTNFVSTKGKSKYELWSKFLSILVLYGNSIKTIDPEEIIRDGLIKYPHESAHLWASLAKMYMSGGFISKSRDIYLEALNSITTLKDYNIIYDSYMEFEYALVTSLDEILEMRGQELEQVEIIIKNVQQKKLDEEKEKKVAKRTAILGVSTATTATTATASTTASTTDDVASTETNTTTTVVPAPATTITTTKKKKTATTTTTTTKNSIYGVFGSEKQLFSAQQELLFEITQLEHEFDLVESRIEFYTQCRDLFINNTLLRQNPHNVNEWLVRVKLFQHQQKLSPSTQHQQKIIDTYQQALEIVDPIIAIGRYHDLWLSLINLYLSFGQIDVVRDFYEQLIFTTQQSTDAMVYVWCKYAEMEILWCHKQCDELIAEDKRQKSTQTNPSDENENENDDENDDENDGENDDNFTPQLESQLGQIKRHGYLLAKNILERATNLRPSNQTQKTLSLSQTLTKSTQTPQHVALLQQQLGGVTKSLKIWSFYLDIVESTCSFEYTKHTYSKFLSLKIHTPSILLQYISLLLKHNFIEDVFVLFEQSVKSDFQFPTSLPIWFSYLSTFMSIYGTTKQLRLRELFNSVLNHPQLPSDYVKVFYLLFIRYESKYGTPRRLLQIIHTACQKVPQGEKCAFYKLYIVKIVQNYGLLHTRDVFQESLGQVAGGIGAKTPSQPNQTKFSSSKHHEKELYEIGRTFIRLELKLNQTNRARAIYQYIAKAINPTGNYGQIWDEFKEFEASFGDVTSFKAFGALKRQTIQYYKETALYRRALAAQEKQFELAEKEKKELEMKRLLAQKE